MNLSLTLTISRNYPVFSSLLSWKDVNPILYYYIMDHKLKTTSSIICKKDFKTFHTPDDRLILSTYKISAIHENAPKHTIVIVTY